ncbi:lysophospholipid acyltransferase family protein [Oceanicaulis alexandrii]|uniref:lysophospholipid acyltransferase family protein n=1 Tax=Oceanicaulis alexandrii TaxID=153233 RepID=UPI00235397D9|nr:lysophospholipid acyltransferase family protein [Oceanicaulis alexandrii]
MPVAALRSAIFVVWMYGLMLVMGLLCAPFLLGPRSGVKACMRLYLALVFGGLHWICGIRYEVRGREHLPEGGALIASKHQSMFETLAFWAILDDPAIILKKELSYLPVFGWYAMKLKNIKVDRAAGAKALRNMLKQARERASEGRQVVIFPQGTRLEPGEHDTYKPGVIGLYNAMKTPCVPVALNSGLYWPPHGFVRKPGLIIVEFLPAIEPGLSKDAFMTELQTRIETASDALLSDTSQKDAA